MGCALVPCQYSAIIPVRHVLHGNRPFQTSTALGTAATRHASRVKKKKNALPTYTRKPGLIDGNNIITRGLPPGRLARAAGDTRDPQSPAWGGTIFLFFWNVSRGLDVLGYWRGGNCGFAFSVEYRACGDAIVRFGAVGGEVWDVRDRGPEAWRDGRFRMGTGACGY